MSKINIDLWLLIICIAIPFLCLITTYFFIFNRKSISSKHASLFMDGQSPGDFEAEITFQVAYQQLDLLLANTINDLEKQRLLLQKYLTKKIKSTNILPQNSNKINDYTKQIDHGEIRQKLSSENDYRHIRNSMSSYKVISELFQSGMTSKQIAKKIQIPQAEIDLYIKLHLKEQNLKNPALIRQLSV